MSRFKNRTPLVWGGIAMWLAGCCMTPPKVEARDESRDTQRPLVHIELQSGKVVNGRVVRYEPDAMWLERRSSNQVRYSRNVLSVINFETSYLEDRPKNGAGENPCGVGEDSNEW